MMPRTSAPSTPAECLRNALWLAGRAAADAINGAGGDFSDVALADFAETRAQAAALEPLRAILPGEQLCQTVARALAAETVRLMQVAA